MNDQKILIKLVGVRFAKVGKVYHFSADHIAEVRIGDQVVVDTARGNQLGEVAQIIEKVPEQIQEDIKPVDRIATPRDLLLKKSWEPKEAQILEVCKKRSKDLRMTNVKIISAESSLDGSKVSVFYSNESDEKYDLKPLRSEILKIIPDAQIDFRQIGPRDVAKALGGMGACGLDNRCCSKFLMEFNSISIRMAKEQGISLTPSEITGMCGRLRCCLLYEFENYSEARKGLPKRGKRILTPAGEGKVIDVQALQGIIRVDIPEVGVRLFTREEITAFSGEVKTQREEIKTFEDVSFEPSESTQHQESRMKNPRRRGTSGKRRRSGNRS